MTEVTLPMPVHHGVSTRVAHDIKCIVVDKELYANGLPVHATGGSAGVDLLATQDLVLSVGKKFMMDTGLRLWIERPDLVALILPRSGAGTKGLTLANTVGVIDSDYQGSLKVSLYNSNQPHTFDGKFEEDGSWVTGGEITIKRGDKIAQYLLMPVIAINLLQVENFGTETERGSGGFGSTGK